MTAMAKVATPSPWLLWPGVVLGVFFVIPLATIVAVSVYHRVQGGLFTPAFELGSYARLLTPFFAKILGFSLFIAALAAAMTVAIALPFVAIIAGLRRRTQVSWLILILAVMSLSEVIVGFAWTSLLSRTAGLSNVLVALGILDRPQAWYPGFAALLLGLVYLGLPFAALVLFPIVSRLDHELPAMARMLGASPARAAITITLPILRNGLVATFITVFVFDLGSYLLPQVLGRPEHWTLSVLITDQALFQSNVPFAAALAIVLTLVTAGLIALSLALGRSRNMR